MALRNSHSMFGDSLLYGSWLSPSIPIQVTRPLINLKIGGDGLGSDIQAAAFCALEPISQYRGKIAEVAGTVGVSDSHGTLMQVVLKMAKELKLERAACKREFID
ncbi:uncharacterized protein VP01_4429g2 [Puccinia sorghi]|uniref:Uncharacterized protein n=1 Tax=Puccinia sorghi TaxID=27349 RepID=A0A0L6URH9_9BASI|nr:uncharacterized protein VP01_4429g2 [Puccinia sorghi]